MTCATEPATVSVYDSSLDIVLYLKPQFRKKTKKHAYDDQRVIEDYTEESWMDI